MDLFKKQWLGLGCALLLIVVAAIMLVANSSGLSDAQIKKKFACSRVTADRRATDVYCSDPDLYREHLKNNTVVN